MEKISLQQAAIDSSSDHSAVCKRNERNFPSTLIIHFVYLLSIFIFHFPVNHHHHHHRMISNNNNNKNCHFSYLIDIYCIACVCVNVCKVLIWEYFPSIYEGKLPGNQTDWLSSSSSSMKCTWKIEKVFASFDICNPIAIFFRLNEWMNDDVIITFSSS